MLFTVHISHSPQMTLHNIDLNIMVKSETNLFIRIDNEVAKVVDMLSAK